MSGQPPPWRTWLVQGAKLAVVVAALTWLLRSGRLDLTDLCFDRQGLPWVAAGALLTLGPFFLSFYRLYWMLRATDCSLPLGSVVRIGFIGSFFNTFTLGSVGGDVVKLGYLANASGRPAAAFASVLLDRAISLLALLTLGVLALLVGSGHLVGSVGVQGLMLVTLLLLGGAAFCGVVGIVAMARGRRVGLAVWGVITLGLCWPWRPWALLAPGRCSRQHRLAPCSTAVCWRSLGWTPWGR